MQQSTFEKKKSGPVLWFKCEFCSIEDIGIVNCTELWLLRILWIVPVDLTSEKDCQRFYLLFFDNTEA